MELSIQEHLKYLRVERGLTLEQLAEETHLSKYSLGSYEGTISKTSATMPSSSWQKKIISRCVNESLKLRMSVRLYLMFLVQMLKKEEFLLARICK